jgi:hypothetical protein
MTKKPQAAPRTHESDTLWYLRLFYDFGGT